MPVFGHSRYSLKLGSRHAVWVEESWDWRGRLLRRSRVVDLPKGLVRPSPLEPNISDQAALEALLRAMIGSERKGELPVALVLPDLCVRATVLALNAMPARSSERDALVRWRLEQESAFPLAGAKVVSRLLGSKTVLAVMIRETVLRQYETVCEAIGLCPVEVDTASFCLGAELARPVPAAEPVAWLSLLDGGFTFMVLRAGRPTFLRTKLQPSAGQDGVFRDFDRSLTYYGESHADARPRRLMLLSEDEESELARRVTDELGLAVTQVREREVLPAITRRQQAPLRINLSSSPRSYLGPLRAGLALLALLLVGLIAWDLARARAIEVQVAKAEQALVRVRDQESRLLFQAQAERVDLSDAALQRLSREVAFANQVIAKRAFSWTRFLGDLEQAVPQHLAVYSIRLDFKNSAITIGGAAKSLQDLTTFIISLEDHPAFSDAVLAQHRVLESGLVEFGLTVRYHSQSTGG